MAQEYEVTWFQPTDFADNHNNYWCNVAFQGVSEPLKWVVKDPTKVKVGDKVFGEIKEQTSKAGKPYQRFYRAERPDDTQQSLPTGGGYKRDDSHIRAQWAIGQAISHLGGDKDKTLEDVETLAGALFVMVDRVKNPKVDAPDKWVKSVEEQVAQEQAKRDRDIIHSLEEGTPINLDEIPF